MSNEFSKVVSEDDVIRKKRESKHSLQDFLFLQDVGDIKDYVIWSVIVPGFCGLVGDALHGIVDRTFGKSSGSKSRYGYDREYRRRDYASRYEVGRRKMAYSASEDIIFRSRAKAEEIRDTLYEIVDRKGYVTVAHLNDLLDVPYNERSDKDDRYGWDSVDRVRVRATRDGFILDMPRAERID